MSVRTPFTALLLGLTVATTSAQPPVQAPPAAPSRIHTEMPTPTWPETYSNRWPDLYGELTGKTILRSAAIPKLPAAWPPDLLQDTNRAIAFIEGELATGGFEAVPDGEKFLRLLPAIWRNSTVATDLARIQPSAAGGEEVPKGSVIWMNADLASQALPIYAELTHRTVLYSPMLPCCGLHFRNQSMLTKNELIYGLQVVLALNGIAVIHDGDKYVQVVPVGQASQIETGAPKPEPGAKLIDPAAIPAFKFEQPPACRLPPGQRDLPKSTRELRKPTVDNLVAYYAKLTSANPIPSKQFGKQPIHFEITTPVTRVELLYAIKATLAQCNLAIESAEQNSIQVVHWSALHKVKTNSAVGHSSSPSAYTVNIGLNSRWFRPSGEVAESNDIRIKIAIDPEKALIQPWAAPGNTNNLGFLTWATSPFQAGEWIVGARNRGPDDKLANVIIDNHPLLYATDTFANLARILYLPQNHPTYRGLKENERLYIPIESSGYAPDEIEFRTTNREFNGNQLVCEIAAFTPSYYHNQKEKKPFRSPPPNRTLWLLSITQFTNWHQISMPSRFSYVRYLDPDCRVEAESKIPIVLLDGWLISAEVGAETDITSRLEQQLTLVDYRPALELGRCVRYSVPRGAWPRLNTEEYKHMVATNRIARASSSK
jgi:hypothetical protein